MQHKDFTKTELKHVKYLIMKRGMKEKEADEEIRAMVLEVRKNKKELSKRVVCKTKDCKNPINKAKINVSGFCNSCSATISSHLGAIKSRLRRKLELEGRPSRLKTGFWGGE